MTTYTKALGAQAAINADWETAKKWAKDRLTKERVREAALCVATVSLIGVVVVSLHKAMESYIILGF